MVKCVYDYFYGAQADQFSFYRVPKVLFTNDRFREVSAEAKILYSILLERMDLSAKNGWIDDQGRVYIICTIEEIGDIFAGQTGTYDMHPIPGTEDLYYTIAGKKPLKCGNKTYYMAPAVIFGIDEEAGEVVSPNVRQLYAAARYFEEHSTAIKTREGEVSVFNFD